MKTSEIRFIHVKAAFFLAWVIFVFFVPAGAFAAEEVEWVSIPTASAGLLALPSEWRLVSRDEAPERESEPASSRILNVQQVLCAEREKNSPEGGAVLQVFAMWSSDSEGKAFILPPELLSDSEEPLVGGLLQARYGRVQYLGRSMLPTDLKDVPIVIWEAELPDSRLRYRTVTLFHDEKLVLILIRYLPANEEYWQREFETIVNRWVTSLTLTPQQDVGVPMLPALPAERAALPEIALPADIPDRTANLPAVSAENPPPAAPVQSEPVVLSFDFMKNSLPMPLLYGGGAALALAMLLAGFLIKRRKKRIPVLSSSSETDKSEEIENTELDENEEARIFSMEEDRRDDGNTLPKTPSAPPPGFDKVYHLLDEALNTIETSKNMMPVRRYYSNLTETAELPLPAMADMETQVAREIPTEGKILVIPQREEPEPLAEEPEPTLTGDEADSDLTGEEFSSSSFEARTPSFSFSPESCDLKRLYLCSFLLMALGDIVASLIFAQTSATGRTFPGLGEILPILLSNGSALMAGACCWALAVRFLALRRPLREGQLSVIAAVFSAIAGAGIFFLGHLFFFFDLPGITTMWVIALAGGMYLSYRTLTWEKNDEDESDLPEECEDEETDSKDASLLNASDTSREQESQPLQIIEVMKTNPRSPQEMELLNSAKKIEEIEEAEEIKIVAKATEEPPERMAAEEIPPAPQPRKEPESAPSQSDLSQDLELRKRQAVRNAIQRSEEMFMEMEHLFGNSYALETLKNKIPEFFSNEGGALQILQAQERMPGTQPDCFIFQLCGNILLDLIRTGRYHIGKGILSGEGSELVNLFRCVGGGLLQCGCGLPGEVETMMETMQVCIDELG